MLPSENADQIESFLSRHSNFAALAWRPIWDATVATPPPATAGNAHGLLMTPHRFATDGFFVAVLERRG
jgi:16S rRNA (cytosine967-C5)-methyltransferase